MFQHPKQRRRKDDSAIFCLCGHSSYSHKWRKDQCRVWDCNCRSVSGANIVTYQRIAGQLYRLGFDCHMNRTAVCTTCLEDVEIGYWTDPLTPQRAAAHRRQCHAKTTGYQPNCTAKLLA